MLNMLTLCKDPIYYYQNGLTNITDAKTTIKLNANPTIHNMPSKSSNITIKAKLAYQNKQGYCYSNFKLYNRYK